MKRLMFLLAALLSACALTPPAAQGPLGAGEIASAHAARAALALGLSTQTDVRKALGEAIVVDFESGYEVWVYRERPVKKAERPPLELVLLFDPSGMLANARVR